MDRKTFVLAANKAKADLKEEGKIGSGCKTAYLSIGFDKHEDLIQIEEDLYLCKFSDSYSLYLYDLFPDRISTVLRHEAFHYGTGEDVTFIPFQECEHSYTDNIVHYTHPLFDYPLFIHVGNDHQQPSFEGVDPGWYAVVKYHHWWYDYGDGEGTWITGYDYVREIEYTTWDDSGYGSFMSPANLPGSVLPLVINLPDYDIDFLGALIAQGGGEASVYSNLFSWLLNNRSEPMFNHLRPIELVFPVDEVAPGMTARVSGVSKLSYKGNIVQLNFTTTVYNADAGGFLTVQVAIIDNGEVECIVSLS